MRHRVGRVLAVGGFLLIAVATLLPLPEQQAAARSTSLTCLVCGEYGGVDVIGNLLLFLPFAAGLSLLNWRVGSVVLTGALLSLTVETLQLLLIPGRDASLSDLLTNTLSSWLGAALAGQANALVWPAIGGARRLAFGAVLAWCGVQAGSGILLRPWIPAEELRGDWTRHVPGRELFAGTVVSASASGIPIPDDSLPLEPSLVAALRRGDIALQIEFKPEPRLPSRSPIVEVLGRSGTVLGLEADGEDLIFQAPARAQALRLRHPALRLRRVMTDRSPVQVTAREHQISLLASWTGPDDGGRAHQDLGPRLGWSLIVPFKYAYGNEVPWLSALWGLAWLLPIGYWAAASGQGRLGYVWLPLTLLVGFGLVPHLSGYPAEPWLQWLAGAAGLGVGWAGHRWAAYYRQRCDSPFISESSSV